MPFFGSTVAPTSFSFYIISISVGLQALLFVSIGSFADYGGWRKTLLFAGTAVGGVACLFMLAITEASYLWAAAILAVVINLAFGLTSVCYNAYLPLLARGTRQVMMADAIHKAESSSSSPPEETSTGSHAVTIAYERMANFISTRSFVVGYLSAVLFLIFCAIFVYFLGQSTYL